MKNGLNNLIIRILLAGSTFAPPVIVGGCNGDAWNHGVNRPSAGALLAAGATANALNAKTQREAAAWAGLAEYGRAEAARDAAREGRSEQTVIVNTGTDGRSGRGRNDDNSGIAVLRLDDQIYRGEVLNGRPHGTGKLQYPNGAWCEGEFRNGVRHGRIKMFYPDGAVIEATYLDDSREGLIIQKCKTGKILRWYEHKGKDLGESEEEYDRAVEAEKVSGR